MAPYFWKMAKRLRSSNQGGNARSRSPSPSARGSDNARDGGRLPLPRKRRSMAESTGRTSGNVSLRFREHAEGSRFNPILVADSDTSSDNSGRSTDSDQVNYGRNSTRNVPLRLSSSGRSSLNNGNDMEDSDFDPASDSNLRMPYSDTEDSDSELDYILMMSHPNYLSAFSENDVNHQTGRPAAHVAHRQSAQPVGFRRGASSGSSNRSHVDQTEAARRMSEDQELLELHELGQHLAQLSRNRNMSEDEELLELHELGQHLAQLSRNRNISVSVSGGSGNAPTPTHVTVPALDAETNTGANTHVGRTWGTRHSFSSGRGTAEVRRSSAATAGRIVHPRAINNQPRISHTANPWPRVYGINGHGSNHPNAFNSQRLPMASAGPLRQPTSVSGMNYQRTYTAGASSIQQLPVSLAPLSRWPNPVSAPNGQSSLLVNHSNSASENNRRMIPDNTWHMPMTAVAPSSLPTSASGSETRQSLGGRDGNDISFQSSAATVTDLNMLVESDSESEHESEPELEEESMELNNSSGADSENDDAHVDMRLDVDEMSYEELLDLEDQIGNVNTGLTEEAVMKCLRLGWFLPRKQETDPCCICQEEYKRAERIGYLINCGHSFHLDCIKKWLIVKDVCPICKRSAGSSSK